MGKIRVQARDSDRASLKTCVHHWVFEPVSGPTSKGVCKKCGDTCDGQNFMPMATFRNIGF